MKSFPALKDPDEVKDFGVVWNLLATGETIIDSQWFLDQGTVVLGVGAVLDNITSVWVSGGVDGEECLVRNRITTSNNPPRIYERTGKLNVQSL